MENLVEKSVAMASIPRTRATELLPTEVSNGNVPRKEDKLQKGIEEKLAITECNGETQPNLDSVISHYVQNLHQYDFNNLGNFHFITCFTSLYKRIDLYTC